MADACASQNIKGHRLGSIHEEGLEKKIHDAIKSKAEINKLSEKLQDKYIKQMKVFDQERKGWNRNSLRNNTEIQKLRTHALQVINKHKQIQNENTNLISHNAQKDIYIVESKAENVTKSKKIKSLEFMIKILESKLSSAQKDVISIQSDLSKKESEILSLKSKIVEVEHELASKVSELECLKSEAISNPILGGDDEGQSPIVSKIKNTQSREQSSISNSSNISVVSDPRHPVTASGNKNLSKYFIHGKNMDQTEKIDNGISVYTNDEIIELPKNDTEINPKINEETNISEINKDDILDISIKPNASEAMPQNVTPHLIQPDNKMSSLIESHSQMRPSLEALPLPIGGIGAIRPNLEALPLPVMTSTLMTPLSAYVFLTLLIIAIMWFVILRRTWNIGKKSNQLQDMWVG
ncbi:hypothetical protein C2G38_2045863 [Gigaspora rosea]|uniref:Uncharacterized protein n=1 Tax=Gigaspora rosea TaxID=44941 RepID=A0A397UEK6_9GLOM|nr:hypothetical protein C2G38_2045863 [Gigaspora rosea]